MERLIIVGSGSVARYAIEIATREKTHDLVGLADLDNRTNVGKQVSGFPVLCLWDEMIERFLPSEYRIIVAYGDNDRKRKVAQALDRQGYGFVTLISSAAYIAASARIGEGCIINPMAAIMPDAKLGCHIVVHSHAVIEHDNVIGDFANIAPGVSIGGNVKVGQGSYIYTGANVVPKRSIGKWAVVGAGAVVIDDVPDESMVVGAPARIVGKGKGD